MFMENKSFSDTLAETFAKAKDNVGFLLVCLGIFAGIFIIALLFEKFLIKSRRKLSDTRSITFIALFSAMAAVLMLLEFPLLFVAPGFYQLDFSEVPVMICTFYLGPVAGVVTELIKIVLKLFIKGTSTAFVGDFANFVVGCSFVLPASIIYHTKPNTKRLIAGLAVGTGIMTVFGSAFNAIYLIPKFAQLFGMPIDAIVDAGHKIFSSVTDVPTFAAFCVAPFNLIKGAAVSILAFLLFKAVSRYLKLPAMKTKKQQ